MKSCECENWPRAIVSPYNLKSADGIPLVTNHHENCPHYNDSLMDTFRHSEDGKGGCYFESLDDALDSVRQEFEYLETDKAVITKEKIHREVFENLQEFDGF